MAKSAPAKADDAPNVELETDAWERFEKAVDQVITVQPKPKGNDLDTKRTKHEAG